MPFIIKTHPNLYISLNDANDFMINMMNMITVSRLLEDKFHLLVPKNHSWTYKDLCDSTELIIPESHSSRDYHFYKSMITSN